MAGVRLVRIWSSDRERAVATARMVAAPHGLDVETTSALREIDFGAWEGRALGDLWSEEPAASRAWEENFRATPPTFGESLDDVERRVSAFWDSLQPLPVRGEVAVVAHRGSLAVLRALITGEAVSEAFAGQLELASAVAVPLV
jgi:broad specificity phosphatase PhoE